MDLLEKFLLLLNNVKHIENFIEKKSYACFSKVSFQKADMQYINDITSMISNHYVSYCMIEANTNKLPRLQMS